MELPHPEALTTSQRPPGASQNLTEFVDRHFNGDFRASVWMHFQHRSDGNSTSAAIISLIVLHGWVE